MIIENDFVLHQQRLMRAEFKQKRNFIKWLKEALPG